MNCGDGVSIYDTLRVSVEDLAMELDFCLDVAELDTLESALVSLYTSIALETCFPTIA